MVIVFDFILYIPPPPPPPPTELSFSLFLSLSLSLSILLLIADNDKSWICQHVSRKEKTKTICGNCCTLGAGVNGKKTAAAAAAAAAAVNRLFSPLFAEQQQTAWSFPFIWPNIKNSWNWKTEKKQVLIYLLLLLLLLLFVCTGQLWAH